MKFAFITPRYGAEITHGAEHVCRLLAEQVSDRHDVDVLTTCARDAATWKNDYPEGTDRIRGVLVRRFSATGARDNDALRNLTLRLSTTAHARTDELEWLRRTGSVSSGLIEYLKRQQRNYDALVFFSYWAGTTIHGLAVAPERSVLFPGAQIEAPLRFGISREALGAPSGIGYCSPTERTIVRAHVRSHPRGEEIIGVGVSAVPEAQYPRLQQELGTSGTQPPEDEQPEAVDMEEPPAHLSGRGILFRRRHRLDGRFALYGGRVDADNGTEELLEYFDSFAAQDADATGGEPHGERSTALVIMGVKMMKLPAEPWLRLAGVLPARERMVAMEAADVAIAPDPDDLVAEHVLESFAVGTPVLASARNGAAVDHCRRANAGLYYANREEFVAALRAIMTNTRLREALGRNGRKYVQQHYRWDVVLSRFERLVGRVKGR
jgi:glycosyltransferase involved in cell wall biosynthesis